jgi:hypothetical protein
MRAAWRPLAGSMLTGAAPSLAGGNVSLKRARSRRYLNPAFRCSRRGWRRCFVGISLRR